MDVDSIFLIEEFEEGVYMESPQGFEDHEEVFCWKIEDCTLDLDWWIKVDPIWFLSNGSRMTHVLKEKLWQK